MDIKNFMENLIALLKEQFSSVYCDTCKANEEDNYDACCECHRKAMNWEISNYTAESVANKAIELLTDSAAKDGAE